MPRKVTGVIPARMGSKRFAGKVLYQHHGQPLLFYVWRLMKRVKLIDRLVIATDSSEIARAADTFGAEVIRTSARHRTGSDRAAEVMQKIGGEIIVNIQADTVGLPPSTIDRVLTSMIADSKIRCATLARKIDSDGELFDPDTVKVITTADGRALWFSRFPLPYLQTVGRGERAGQYGFLAHIGVYFFRRRELELFAESKQTKLERAESLEQLRLLELGRRIDVFRTAARAGSIDRPRDLEKISVR